MHNKLKNKTVAIVGPAMSLRGTGKGEYIDSHDIVVRLNYAKIESVYDSGSRTDIVYYDGSYHEYTDCNPSILVCAYPPTEWFYKSRCEQNVNFFKERYEHYVVDSELYGSLKKSFKTTRNCRPNSGTMAIVDLLQSDLKKLYITGIDFYRTPYLSSHPDYGKHTLSEVKKVFAEGDNGDFHDTDVQFEYFKNELLKDDRIEMDDYLRRIITGEDNARYRKS